MIGWLFGPAGAEVSAWWTDDRLKWAGVLAAIVLAVIPHLFNLRKSNADAYHMFAQSASGIAGAADTTVGVQTQTIAHLQNEVAQLRAQVAEIPLLKARLAVLERDNRDKEERITVLLAVLDGLKPDADGAARLVAEHPSTRAIITGTVDGDA